MKYWYYKNIFSVFYMIYLCIYLKFIWKSIDMEFLWKNVKWNLGSECYMSCKWINLWNFI